MTPQAAFTHPSIENHFDLSKVENVLNRYKTLFAALDIQARRRAAGQESGDDTLSLCHPDIAREHDAVVRALSHDFSAAETAWLLSHPDIRSRQPRMWSWLSRAEAALERRHSKALDGESLRSFLNFGAYTRLIDEELAHIGRAGKRSEGVAFVGAGPLPLSAVLIHQKTGRRVTCLDQDGEAATLGADFIRRCGLSENISYRHARGDTFDYRGYAYVFVAGLAQEKEKVLRRIASAPSVGMIAVRGTTGMGSLLDKPFSPHQAANIPRGRLNSHTQPQPPFFNTTWFLSAPFLSVPG